MSDFGKHLAKAVQLHIQKRPGPPTSSYSSHHVTSYMQHIQYQMPSTVAETLFG